VIAVRADQIKLLVLVVLAVLAAVSGGGFFDQWFIY
jgi:hypothetical protein